MPAWLQQILMSAGVFTVLGSVVRGFSVWPKTRGEGKQAEGAGTKSQAEAEVARSVERRAEMDNILRQASDARQGAQKAEQECRDQIRRMRDDFEAFADVIEELVPLLPAGESQRKARVALRAARLAI